MNIFKESRFVFDGPTSGGGKVAPVASEKAAPAPFVAPTLEDAKAKHDVKAELVKINVARGTEGIKQDLDRKKEGLWAMVRTTIDLDRFFSKPKFAYGEEPKDMSPIVTAQILKHFEYQDWDQIALLFKADNVDHLKDLMSKALGSAFVNDAELELDRTRLIYDKYIKANPKKADLVSYYMEGGRGMTFKIRFTPADFAQQCEVLKAPDAAKSAGAQKDAATKAGQLMITPLAKILGFFGYKEKPTVAAEVKKDALYFEDIFDGGLFGGHALALFAIELFGYGKKFGTDLIGTAISVIPGKGGEQAKKAYDKIAEPCRKSPIGNDAQVAKEAEAAKGTEVPVAKFRKYLSSEERLASGEVVRLATDIPLGVESMPIAAFDVIFSSGSSISIPAEMGAIVDGAVVSGKKGELIPYDSFSTNSKITLAGKIPAGTLLKGSVTFRRIESAEG